MRRALAAAAALVAVAAAGGCKSQPGAVDLTIVADASLPDATVASIRVLELNVTGAATIDQPYLLDHPFSSARQERVVLRPPVSSGTLTISVLAHAPDGTPVGYGSTDVALKSGGAVAATVTLTGDVPSPGDGGMPADMGAPPGAATLSLVAGKLGGQGYADGAGGDARFNNPRAVVFAGGDLFVADMNNHVIRRITTATGGVTTLAGAPLQAGNVDGVGNAARFNRPDGIASDGSNLYVADLRNDTIRKVVIATGAVTTLAGSAGNPGSADGTGAAARFDHPHGVATDGTTVWVVDTYNQTIRAVDVASGAVTTLAGTAGSAGFADGTGAAARFRSPHGIAFDGTNLYVADSGNHCIRMIVPGTGAVTTPFGTGLNAGWVDANGNAARFNSPRGIVADGAGNLWVADSSNERVRKIVIATGAVTTLAGHNEFGDVDGVGAGAGFSTPLGIASDGAGNLYVAEAFGHTVRKVTAAGVATTFAGRVGGDGIADGTGDAARFTRPHGLCVDGTTLYVADKQNNVVRKVDAAGAVTTLAGSGQPGGNDGTGALARFNGPFACAADGAGTLYVTDANSHTVRAIDLSSGAVTTLAGTAGAKGSTDGTGAAARFNTTAGIAYGGGKLYVADLNNQTVRVVDVASKAVTTLAGTAGAKGSTDGTGAAARFNSPNGLALVGGTLYVADQGNSTIRAVDVAAGAVTTLAGAANMRGTTDGTGAAARFFNPHALASDGAGNLYVADTLNHTVRKIVLATGAVSTLLGSAGVASVKLGAAPAGLNTPAGIAVDAGGALYIATAHENAVVVYR